MRGKVLARALVVGAMFAFGSATVDAAALTLRLAAAATGKPFAERALEVASGEESRLVENGVVLPGRVGVVDVVFTVRVEREAGGTVVTALNGIVRAPRETTPLAWTARSYTLRSGESASFTVEPPRGGRGVEFTLRYDGAFPSARADGAAPLSTLLRIREQTPDGDRVIEERRLSLFGEEATEVVIDMPGGGSPQSLVLRITPRARGPQGASLDLEVESRGGAGSARVVQRKRLELGFTDEVRIHGLRGPLGPVSVELAPQR